LPGEARAVLGKRRAGVGRGIPKLREGPLWEDQSFSGGKGRDTETNTGKKDTRKHL